MSIQERTEVKDVSAGDKLVGQVGGELARELAAFPFMKPTL
jgi:hypothetical protein